MVLSGQKQEGIEVTSIGAGFNNNGVEKYFHGDTDGCACTRFR